MKKMKIPVVAVALGMVVCYVSGCQQTSDTPLPLETTTSVTTEATKTSATEEI